VRIFIPMAAVRVRRPATLASNKVSRRKTKKNSILVIESRKRNYNGCIFFFFLSLFFPPSFRFFPPFFFLFLFFPLRIGSYLFYKRDRWRSRWRRRRRRRGGGGGGGGSTAIFTVAHARYRCLLNVYTWRTARRKTMRVE
jgi:hypothetical protein